MRHLSLPIGRVQVGVCIGDTLDAAQAGRRRMVGAGPVADRIAVLHYVRQGSGVYLEAGQPAVPVEAGNCFQRFPGRFHEIRLHAAAYEQWYCMLSRELLEHLVALDTVSPAVVLRPSDPTAVEQAFLDLAAALSAPALLAADVVSLLTRLLAAAQQVANEEAEDWFARAHRLLVAEHAAAPRLEDVARACGMPYDRFRRAFREQAGLAPYEYRIRHRIERAQALLPVWPIKRIVGHLGYTDAAAFARQFRKHTGMSPSAYREQLAGEG